MVHRRSEESANFLLSFDSRREFDSRAWFVAEKYFCADVRTDRLARPADERVYADNECHRTRDRDGSLACGSDANACVMAGISGVCGIYDGVTTVSFRAK